ncbi:signal peptide protein [Paenibacillus timonensis]|nr:hypothetical protein [Paenibacillus timonensis]MCH1640078.1 signal peptide protein [Paenibacillus timonensis]
MTDIYMLGILILMTLMMVGLVSWASKATSEGSEMR